VGDGVVCVCVVVGGGCIVGDRVPRAQLEEARLGQATFAFKSNTCILTHIRYPPSPLHTHTNTPQHPHHKTHTHTLSHLSATVRYAHSRNAMYAGVTSPLPGAKNVPINRPT
jgi:hypothetical protein